MNDKVIGLMTELANEHELPVNYRNDLEIDFDYIRKYSPRAFGWVIRTNGTHLIDYKPDYDWIDVIQYNFGHDDKLVWFWFGGTKFVDMSDKLWLLASNLRSLPDVERDK